MFEKVAGRLCKEIVEKVSRNFAYIGAVENFVYHRTIWRILQ
jgi:hypothetical protein